MGTSVKDFLQYEANDEQLSKLFYNMSVAMKYVHHYDYYIDNFDLSSITIENSDDLNPIRYQNIRKMPTKSADELITENIFVLALLQIGVYTGTINYLNSKFIQENFKEFENFLPSDDLPYLRGVIERRSPVYYSDYVNEKNKREIEKLESETGINSINSEGKGISKKKATEIGSAFADKETQKLYGNLDEKQAAFTTFLILPLAMILLGIVLSVILLMH